MCIFTTWDTAAATITAEDDMGGKRDRGRDLSGRTDGRAKVRANTQIRSLSCQERRRGEPETCPPPPPPSRSLRAF